MCSTIHSLSAHFGKAVPYSRKGYWYDSGTFDPETWVSETKRTYHTLTAVTEHLYTACRLGMGSRIANLLASLLDFLLFIVGMPYWWREKVLMNSWKNRTASWVRTTGKLEPSMELAKIKTQQ